MTGLIGVALRSLASVRSLIFVWLRSLSSVRSLMHHGSSGWEDTSLSDY
jgi:hypothetical protein